MNDNHQSDIDLIYAIKAGNKKAFDTFFIRYYAVLCAYSKQFVSIEDGQDIVQDIMVNMWLNRGQLLVATSPRQYFFQSVKNRCLTFLSRNELKEKVQKTVHENMGYMHDAPDFYIVEELTLKIEEALKRLPESYRIAFELNRFRDMTYNEIAEKLSLSPKTIDYRIQQALKLLRRDLKEYLPSFIGLL
ncbi:RNA polymerase sigma-70 factor [Massilibacteroides vaginae]|uniref:RNA polymerase sigma-70 factor n=1 Tax=Massilibacteroides vaginae TaxID=1673718 RepID=UPI000A1CE440|nr:RNA polymerase sigma-70 factor [Massilibacteroides vaginae]